jgi:ribosomal protein S18 acetylase RimI-like enzyme
VGLASACLAHAVLAREKESGTMTDVTMRAYRPADLRSCRALWAELVQRHRDLYDDPSIGGEAPGLHFDRHLARVGPERIWVAEGDGRIRGMVALTLDGEEAEIDPIVVSSTHRGQGIGRALLNRVVEEAAALGARYLHVRPVARNRAAISFYYRSGFQLLGRLELFTELHPSAPGTWKPGPELFGLFFEY